MSEIERLVAELRARSLAVAAARERQSAARAALKDADVAVGEAQRAQDEAHRALMQAVLPPEAVAVDMWWP